MVLVSSMKRVTLLVPGLKEAAFLRRPLFALLRAKKIVREVCSLD
jgi:hypothetical protein